MKQTFDIQFSVGQRWARAFISCCAIAFTLRAIAIMLCAIAIMLCAIAITLRTITIKLRAIAITLRVIAIMLCAIPITLRAIALIKKNESLTCYAHAQVGGILFHLSLYTLHIAWRSNHI